MARGSLSKVGDGKWVGVVDAPRGRGEKRRQPKKTFYVAARGAAEKGAAEKMFNAWVAEIQKRKPHKKMTVGELFELFLETCSKDVRAKKMTRSTRDFYFYTSKRIVERFKDLGIEKITFDHLEELFYALSESDLSGKYIYDHFALLKRVLNYAVLKDMLPHNYLVNPIKTLNLSKNTQKPQVFEDDEVVALLVEIEENKALSLIIKTVLYAGLRRGEILGLQWKHVGFREKVLKVEQQLQKGKDFEINVPKCASTRNVPLIEPLFSELRKWQKERKKQMFSLGKSLNPSDFVITNEANQVYDPNLISEYCRKAVKKIECIGGKNNNIIGKTKGGRRGLHTLRHTFASRMIQAGVYAPDLAAILGHHSADFTLRTYVHLFADSKKSAMRKFEVYLAETKIHALQEKL